MWPWIISALIFFLVVVPLLFSIILYRILLVRTSKKKWQRKCSEKDDLEQIEMYEQGEKWGELYSDKMQEVRVKSEKYLLAGQYFDFGAKKAVIIIAGRQEGCRYSCYFAEPYRKSGYNVLVIDNRAHGLSDGRYNCVGYKEWVDIIEWARFLHDEKANAHIICHGICIGASTALFALEKKECPEYIKGLIADGMYINFRESFKNHLDGKPKFPILQLVMLWISIVAKANAFKDGPITMIDKVDRPILFLYSKQDKFSTPEKAQELFDKCVSKKELVWFEKGVHSHVRINNQEKYDNAIIDFVKGFDE